MNINESDIESLNIRKDGNTVIYEVTLKRKTVYCPSCGKPMIGWGHGRVKPIKTSSLREFNGLIHYLPNRYYCELCKITKTQENPFSFNKFRVSHQLLRTVFKYLMNLNYTLKMISDELNISTTQINKYIDSYIVIPPRDLPEWIGIDEVHNPELSYKNSSYLCVLTDGERRIPYDILGSRNKAYLNNYFDGFSKTQREKVKYVTIDLWESYKAVALRCFPNCIVAADPYHYCKHLCDGFDDLRVHLMNQCEYGSNRYYLLKKWNFLLTADNVELDNEPQYNSRFKEKLNRRDILNMMLEEFPVLNEAYCLKEEFRHAVATFDYETMKITYDVFVNMFKDSNIREYDEFLNILINWKKEILNSFLRPYDEHKLSNALTENINGKLGEYLTISHGISNFTRFRKRAMYALNPNILYSVSSTLSSDSKPGKERGEYRKIKE